MGAGVRRDLATLEDILHNSHIYGDTLVYFGRVGHVRRAGASLCHRLPESRRPVDNPTNTDWDL